MKEGGLDVRQTQEEHCGQVKTEKGSSLRTFLCHSFQQDAKLKGFDFLLHPYLVQHDFSSWNQQDYDPCVLSVLIN